MVVNKWGFTDPVLDMIWGVKAITPSHSLGLHLKTKHYLRKLKFLEDDSMDFCIPAQINAYKFGPLPFCSFKYPL